MNGVIDDAIFPAICYVHSSDLNKAQKLTHVPIHQKPELCSDNNAVIAF